MRPPKALRKIPPKTVPKVAPKISPKRLQATPPRSPPTILSRAPPPRLKSPSKTPPKAPPKTPNPTHIRTPPKIPKSFQELRQELTNIRQEAKTRSRREEEEMLRRYPHPPRDFREMRERMKEAWNLDLENGHANGRQAKKSPTIEGQKRGKKSLAEPQTWAEFHERETKEVWEYCREEKERERMDAIKKLDAIEDEMHNMLPEPNKENIRRALVLYKETAKLLLRTPLTLRVHRETRKRSKAKAEKWSRICAAREAARRRTGGKTEDWSDKAVDIVWAGAIYYTTFKLCLRPYLLPDTNDFLVSFEKYALLALEKEQESLLEGFFIFWKAALPFLT